ncbi:MAG: hypothetical protein ABWU14_18290 [Limnospira maxima]
MTSPRWELGEVRELGSWEVRELTGGSWGKSESWRVDRSEVG